MNITANTKFINFGSKSVAKSAIKMIAEKDSSVVVLLSDNRSAHYGDENSIILTASDTINGASYSSLADMVESLVNLAISSSIIVAAIIDHDIEDGAASALVRIPAGNKYCVQAVWEDVTGTNNATITASQSIDEENYDTLKTINSDGEEVDFAIALSGTDGSAQIEDKQGFTGSILKLTFAAGTATGGNLNVYVNILS